MAIGCGGRIATALSRSPLAVGHGGACAVRSAPRRCVRWSNCCDEWSAGGDSGGGGRPGPRPWQRGRQVGGASARRSRGGSVLGSRVLLSRPPRRSGQAVVVGWRRTVSVCQASGARAIRLATGRGGGGSAEPGAIVDAVGGDRLANAAANLAARAGGLSLAAQAVAARLNH